MIRWLSRKGLRASAARRPWRPALELLEDRLAPTVTGFQVSSSAQAESNPSTAINQTTGIVAWTQENNNNDTDIMANFVSPPSSVGGSITVPSSDAEEDNASVAIDQNGDFVIVWQSTEQNANNSDIRYAFYRSGQTTADVFGVVAATNLNEVDPHVAMNKQGAFVVTYTVTDEPSTGNNGQTVETQNVRAKLYDDNGNENAMIRVAVSNSVDEFNPRISMNASGRFAISYMQSNPNQPTTNQKLFVSIYTINSSFTSASKNGNFKIASPSSNSQQIFDQDVAVDKNGNTLVVFNQQTATSPQPASTLKGRRVNSSNSLGSTFNLQASSFDLQSTVRIVINSTTKDFAVTFQFSTGGVSQVYLQEFTKNGTALAPAEEVLSSTGNAGVDTSNSAISINADNTYLVGYVADTNSDDIDAFFGTLT